jgi:hypothetical protein
LGLLLVASGTFFGAVVAPGLEQSVSAQYVRILAAGIGLALLLGVLVPNLRLHVTAAGVLAKLGFLLAWLMAGAAEELAGQAALEAVLVLILGAAGTIFLMDALQEARWESAPTLRLES